MHDTLKPPSLQLAISTRFLAAHEMVTDAEALGFRVLPFDSPSDLEKHLMPPGTVDLVLEINFHDDVYAICRAHNLHYTCWTFDVSRHWIGRFSFTPSDFFFCYDRVDTDHLQAKGIQAEYLPFSAGSLFSRTPCEKEFACPLLLVMNTYHDSVNRNAAHYRAGLELLPAAGGWREALTRLKDQSERLLTESEPDIDRRDFMARLAASMDSDAVAIFKDQPEKWEAFLHGLGQELACRQRLRLGQTLASHWPVVVFGDPHWQTLGLPNILFKGMARYEMLPALYNSAFISVNLTQPQCLTSIPQRVFHVLASGGFLLTNPGAALLDIFTPGTHLDTFASFEELTDKCAYYIAHPGERSRIARQGHAEFERLHTMKARLNHIIERIYTETQVSGLDSFNGGL